MNNNNIVWQVCTVYGLWWVPWLWLILSELLCALTFRDNLVLGFIQTVSPQQWIKDYQQEIVPPHLRGIMRAGYWDTKVRARLQEYSHWSSSNKARLSLVESFKVLLRQQSYAIKNQLGHPKPPTRGFGT